MLNIWVQHMIRLAINHTWKLLNHLIDSECNLHIKTSNKDCVVRSFSLLLFDFRRFLAHLKLFLYGSLSSDTKDWQIILANIVHTSRKGNVVLQKANMKILKRNIAGKRGSLKQEDNCKSLSACLDSLLLIIISAFFPPYNLRNAVGCCKLTTRAQSYTISCQLSELSIFINWTIVKPCIQSQPADSNCTNEGGLQIEAPNTVKVWLKGA